MSDILELLRGKPGCQCAARSSYECCCDMARWPSDYVREAADEIERLRAEIEQQRLELGITGDACGALDSEVKQLRARVAELEADADRWYRRAVALGHPTWDDADRAAAMKETTQPK